MMLLCLDIGNTHILGGVFDDNKLAARFRYATHLLGTSDQFGIFLLQILETHGIDTTKIQVAAVSSVVPGCDYTIRHTLSRYLKVSFFFLQAGVKTGLNIKCKNPNEVGADRIANAIGAVKVFPGKNLVIIDMGTATTFDVITKNRDYLGGAILPGMRLGMESLHTNTAKLTEVRIEAPSVFVGRTTRESIQAGLYFGHLGALREIITGIRNEVFSDEEIVVIGTGGFARLFKDKSLFDALMPDLVLEGLLEASRMRDIQGHAEGL